MTGRRLACVLLIAGLASCSDRGEGGEGAGPSPVPSAIPAAYAPFGDGYPRVGDPCRRLGEAAATSNYLDDSAILVGCPSEASANAIGGKIVHQSDGVWLVSIPSRGPSGGPAASDGSAQGQEGDAKVAGTDYNATADIPCGFGGESAISTCPAGVKRGWGDDGTTLVEVTKADGRKRAIYFRGTTAYGADSAQADGSAGWSFAVSREGDRQTIVFGPETYVVVDAFIEGG